MMKRVCAIAVSTILPTLLAGCANPAPPRPPSLNLPRVSNDLQAERQGEHVHLTWTVATYTTDNLLLPGARAKTSYAKNHRAHAGALAAEICREDIAAHTPCKPITRITVQAGEEASAEDTLPLALQTGAPHLIAYKVRILNAAGRDAGFSAPAYTASGEAPAPLTNLHIRSVRQGAELSWSPSPHAASGESVHITREEIADAQTATTKKIDLSIRATPDPGGTVDRSIIVGKQFRYTVARVRTVTIGKHQLQIFGDPATALSGKLEDTFPPPEPSGLVAIFIPPADAKQKPAIDLSWEPVNDDHLAGYVLYRSEQGSASIRVTAKPIPGTSYHDEVVTPGHTYTYAVSAIDHTGNESPRSAPATETIP